MKRAIRRALTVALLLNLSFLSAAESAKSLYNKGKIAEARQNYILQSNCHSGREKAKVRCQ